MWNLRTGVSGGLSSSWLVADLGDPGGLFLLKSFCGSLEVSEVIVEQEGTGKCGDDVKACIIR